MSIPHLFRCPISLDLFTDPVTLSTGQTYDRPSIERWLTEGHSTCPVTMQKLDVDMSMVPNHTLRHLIDQWLLSAAPDHPNPKDAILAQAASGTTTTTTTTTTSTLSTLVSLKQALQSPDTSIETKLEILKKVRVLSTESDIGQARLIQLGFFQHLLHILFHTAGSVDEELVEVALDCVLRLSPSTQPESLNFLKKESRFASFLLLLDKGNLRIKTSLCYLLETIASSSMTTRELSVILGQNSRVLRVLVSLLHNRTDSEASEAAARAVSRICSIEANRKNAVKNHAVDGLVSYLTHSTRQDDHSRALATLEILVGLEGGKKAVMKNPNIVKLLVKYVFRVSPSSAPSSSSMPYEVDEGCENAVGVLLVACQESKRTREATVNAGVLMQLLLLLQSQCGSKAKAKARALLMLLRSMWDREPGLGDSLHHFK